MEQQIPVRELNQHTSAVLERVAQGVAVTITRGGRPIARLVPISGPSTSLDRLVAVGLVAAPTVRGPVAMPPKYSEGLQDVAKRLVADRESERT